jgi:hypothetical protein
MARLIISIALFLPIARAFASDATALGARRIGPVFSLAATGNGPNFAEAAEPPPAPGPFARAVAKAAGADSGFGDLTGGLETTIDYLPNFTPLERIAITATGNLQRIISSYYNSPVTVRRHQSWLVRRLLSVKC